MSVFAVSSHIHDLSLTHVFIIPKLLLRFSPCATNRAFHSYVAFSVLFSFQQRRVDEQSWHPLGQCELVEAVRWWGCEWVFAGGLSPLMDYYPLWGGVMKWLFITATSTCHQTFPAPLWPHRQIRHHDKRQSQAWLTAFPLSSPLTSCLPRTNVIPMLSSPSSSHTQPELWVHSPLNPPPVLSPLWNNSHSASTA